MRLFNTLTRKIEEFVPIKSPHVGMYTCGPTVYWSTHIGHMSKYVGDDVLKRVLFYNGYQVKHVMNITDVGHLTSDADSGEDKMEKGAKREGVTVWDVAQKYEEEFFETMDSLNVIRPDIVARATEHIKEQIDLIKRLSEKGFTYQTDSAVYFDVSKFPDYWKLSGQKLAEKKTGAREDVVVDPMKKSPYDFALWFKRVGRFANHTMHWDSPWGDGFPGWHIECSAMSMTYLGESFDIHTGGIDHIGVHHPAEIAQSEGATGKKFVNYWIHRVFIMVNGEKMSKSSGNFFTLKDVVSKGYEPLSLRYFFLTGHYRSAQNFTFEALGGAQNALARLRERVAQLREQAEFDEETPENIGCAGYEGEFKEAIDDDLNTPEALAVVWRMLDDREMLAGAILTSLFRFDRVLGLRLNEIKPVKTVTQTVSARARIIAPVGMEIPEEVQRLVAEREELRSSSKFGEADQVRQEIEKMGYTVSDTAEGTKISQSPN